MATAAPQPKWQPVQLREASRENVDASAGSGRTSDVPCGDVAPSVAAIASGEAKCHADRATDASDIVSLAGVARGELEAAARLYDRHAPMLLALAVRVVQQRPEAEDVVHDAFLTLGDRSVHYSPDRGSVAAWLVTLVRNLAIDRVRRRAGRSDILRRVAVEGASPCAESPEALLLAATIRADVRRALASLPERQRRTLEVAFFEGLSYAEIAERDGVPLGTIKSRAARALATLRASLPPA
jgi:RNA polymerase sigma-70 factor (ECF subfamily)